MACEMVGAPPGNVAFVGDEPLTDVAGARKAGLLPVLLDPEGLFPPPNGAEVTLGTLSDLEQVLFQS